MLQISLIFSSTHFDWSVRGLVYCCQHGTRCSFLYLFPWLMRFSPYKDSLWPCHRVMDCIVLFSQEEKRGRDWWKEGKTEGGKERGRKESGALQQWRTWQLSASQKDCAEHLLLSPPPLQPPHYLSIYHKAARSNVCSSQASHMEGERQEGGGSEERKKGEERDRLHVWESRKWRGSEHSSCMYASMICW